MGRSNVGDVDLERFVTAQNSHDTYAHALAELEAGHKTSHWMWFVFPQIAGLGRSGMAQAYAIDGLAEARAGIYPESISADVSDEGSTSRSWTVTGQQAGPATLTLTGSPTCRSETPSCETPDVVWSADLTVR